ncbi:bacteriophage related protein [Gluconobacter frateurii M-2]|nr:bacteriophage related protein [Gluconobacter frateurii M-2]
MLDVIPRLARRVAMGLGLGRQLADTNESGGTPTIQVVLPGGEIRSDVPLLQQYGFRSRPVPGSDMLAVFQAGDRSRGVVVATGDQRGRPTDLQPGEVCVYHPKTGSRILLNKSGGVEISASDGNITLNGDAVISGNLEVYGNAIVETGATGSFTTNAGNTITVRNGIITNIY